MHFRYQVINCRLTIYFSFSCGVLIHVFDQRRPRRRPLLHEVKSEMPNAKKNIGHLSVFYIFFFCKLLFLNNYATRVISF